MELARNTKLVVLLIVRHRQHSFLLIDCRWVSERTKHNGNTTHGIQTKQKKYPPVFAKGRTKCHGQSISFRGLQPAKCQVVLRRFAGTGVLRCLCHLHTLQRSKSIFLDSWIRLIAFFNHLKNLGVRITSTGEAFLQSWMPRERFQFWRLKDSNVLVSFQSSYMKAFQVFHLPAFVSTFIPQIAEIALRTLTSNIGVRVCRFFGFVLGGCLMLFCFIK